MISTKLAVYLTGPRGAEFERGAAFSILPILALMFLIKLYVLPLQPR